MDNNIIALVTLVTLCHLRYDGVRAQVHLMADGSLRFFSRSSKDSSSELPDLIPVMKVPKN